MQLTVYGNSKIIIADHLNPHEIQYGIKAVEKLSAVPGDYSPVYVVSVFLAWGLVLAAMAAFMSLNLVMDAWNIVKTKRASEKDPEFLKKKIPGT